MSSKEGNHDSLFLFISLLCGVSAPSFRCAWGVPCELTGASEAQHLVVPLPAQFLYLSSPLPTEQLIGHCTALAVPGSLDFNRALLPLLFFLLSASPLLVCTARLASVRSSTSETLDRSLPRLRSTTTHHHTLTCYSVFFLTTHPRHPPEKCQSRSLTCH